MSIMNDIVKRGKLKKIKKMIDLELLLKAVNATTKQAKRHGDELWDVCPDPKHKDSSPSWSINVNPDHDRFGTHNCFSCGYGGNFITLTRDKLKQSTGKDVDNKQAAEFIVNLFTLDSVDEDMIYDLILEEREQILHSDDDKDEGPKETELPDEYELITEATKRPLKYLTRPILEGGRGLSIDLIIGNHIGWCKNGLYHNRIIIPFMQEGILISFLARSILPPISTRKKNGEEYVICPKCNELNKYGAQSCDECDHNLTRYVVKKARARYPKGSTMEYMLWGFDELDENLDYVIPVEGAMDRLRLIELGYKNVLCLFGNKISEYQVKLLQKFEQKISRKLRVFLFPDADEGGDILIEYANSKIKYLFQVFVIELPWQPEPNVWLDPGNATNKQIRIAFNKAEKLYKVYSRKF
jgi:5S rRNA maturation endonuclease (ribonuclease M5)/ribosomal protein L40E